MKHGNAYELRVGRGDGLDSFQPKIVDLGGQNEKIQEIMSGYSIFRS
jgi:hypothetical protein